MLDTTLIFIAIITFVATNLDDLFVLMIFFTHPDYRNTQIVIGQYIGILSLILISVLGYFFKFVIPSSFIGLLGIFPIIIGLKNLIELRKNKNDDSNSRKGKLVSRFINSSLISVAAVSFINGGDNIGVYAPLFATLSIEQLYFVILIFLTMIGIWCFISYKLVNNRRSGGKIREYGHLILPFVLIIIGVSILIKSI